MMWIIAILIIILTLSILKDTHVKMYCSYYYGPAKLQEEYDVVMPIWMALIIVILGLLPIANIVLFTVFIIYYATHAGWNPDNCTGYTHVFSLKGENAITRCLLVIKNLLCRKV